MAESSSGPDGKAAQPSVETSEDIETKLNDNEIERMKNNCRADPQPPLLKVQFKKD